MKTLTLYSADCWDIYCERKTDDCLSLIDDSPPFLDNISIFSRDYDDLDGYLSKFSLYNIYFALRAYASLALLLA